MISDQLRSIEMALAIASRPGRGLDASMCEQLVRVLRPCIEDVEDLEERLALDAGPQLFASGFLVGPDLATGENVVPFRRPDA